MYRFKHWLWVVLAVAVAGCIGLLYLRFAPKPAPEPLSLGYSQGMPDIPTLIAAENGYFRDEGLAVRYQKFAAGKLAVEAMLRGEVDVASAAETPIVLQSLKRRDFVVIAQFVHYTAVELLTRSETGIRKPVDLRGHRVGVMAGTSAQFFLDTLLADQGIPPSEISIVSVPAAESVAALVNGRVDAVAAFVPAGHFARLALGERALTVPYDKVRYREAFNFVTRRDFAQRRAQATQGLLRAIRRAIEWASTHRAEAIAIVARRSELDEKIVAELWDEYQLALGLYQAMLGSLENQARWALSNHLGDAAAVPNYLDFIDPAPLLAVAPQTVTLVR